MAKKDGEVYQLKITLKGIRPPIWRRIQVPPDYSFRELHLAIQDAMEWEGNHLHGFEIISPKNGLRELIGPTEDDMPGDRTSDEKNRKLSQYFGNGIEKALYVYDYGDDWIHEIKLEKVLPMDTSLSYPICTAGKRACPPEDIGGVYGYYHMLDVLKDPKSEEYLGMLEWLGEEFDPDSFSPAQVVFYDEEERRRLGIEDEEQDDFLDAWDEDSEKSLLDDDEESHGEDLDEADYSEADDYADEDGAEDESEADAVEGLIAIFTSDEVRSLFEKAKSGDISGLNEDQTMLAFLLKENMDDVSFAMDILTDPERDPDDTADAIGVLSNIFAQARADYQIGHKDPLEAFSFYEAMTKKGLDKGQILRAMADIYVLTVEEEDEATSLENYRKKLVKMSKLTPKKMLKELDKEFEQF